MLNELHQNGSLRIRRRFRGPSVWEFRYRVNRDNGQRALKSKIVGTLAAYPTEADMRSNLRGLILAINGPVDRKQDPAFGAVIDRFIAEEQLKEIRAGVAKAGSLLRYSTAAVYLQLLNKHLRPRWGETPMSVMRPGAIQEWLTNLPLAPKSKANIKGLLHRLFDKAMLWEYIATGRNPMELVEVRGQSRRRTRPTVLTAEQFGSILEHLRDPQRVMVMVAQCMGLRVSEILALQWRDLDIENLTLQVTRGVVNGRVDRVKTEYSEDLLPIHSELASALLEWKKDAFPSVEGWVFANPLTGRPYNAWSIAKHYFRPVARRLGIRFGWHTFRHTYRSWLDATGAPIGVQQKLMRHAQVSTTMNIYGNALMRSKRDANAKVVDIAFNSKKSVDTD
jgi:integrase